MQKSSILKHPLITGTILLTAAGLLSRIIGFFYRIFLSHTIGAEGLGIYQLIFPIYALTFSFTAAGIQTAISKFVAEANVHQTLLPSCPKKAKNTTTPNRFSYLYAGLLLSLFLSGLCTIFLYLYADDIAVHILEESRCTPLLQILALTIPFGAVHSCINGYYYGLQKTTVPAVSQLLEQLARVGGVYLIYRIALERNQTLSINAAVWGLVLGEIVSVLYCITFTRFRKNFHQIPTALGQIFTMALPLTANRVFINLFQSAEAIFIPGKLREFGYQPSEALSVYGVLTGMAMPMILFPSAITNSVSVMLLPAISEAQAKNDISYIKKSIKKSCFYCITFGFACTLGFLILGRWLGIVVFANQLAGTFMVILGWICPFLYLTTTLNSILHGLGSASATFFLNLIGSSIRIFFVFFLIPTLGIKAYLWGMLVSHLIVTGAAVLVLRRKIWKS